MDTSTKTFTDAFKKEVATEALKERNTLSEIADKHGITPSLVTTWRDAFIAGDLFGELTNLQRELAERKKKVEGVKKQLEEVRRENELLRNKTKP